MPDAVRRSPRGPLRVAVVCPYGTSGGGAEEWLLSVIDNAPGTDFSAVVLADGPFVGALRDRGLDVDVIPTGTSAAAVLASGRRLRPVLRRRSPDVAVGNGVKAQLALAPAVCRQLPTLWVKHDHSFDRLLARPLGRLSSVVVATALEVGAPCGRDDLRVIEPARPPDPMPTAQARKLLVAAGLPDDGMPVLAVVGRLVPYKGIDVAIRALAEAADWRLLVIGSDDASSPGEARRLNRIASDLRVADRVHLVGSIPSAGRLLAGASALAVLTRPDGRRTPGREGYGITATEAMLAGIPVVAAGAGPVARRLDTPAGPAGLVVSQGDPHGLAVALGVLSDADLRRTMGARGREAAQGLPGLASVGGQFTQAVALAMDRGPACRRWGGA